MLGFRAKSLFSSCEVCSTLKSNLMNKSFNLQQKLGALRQYRMHLSDQYKDRTVVWTLQGEGADMGTNVLMISTDGLDQAKFSLPREPQLKANAALTLGFIVLDPFPTFDS